MGFGFIHFNDNGEQEHCETNDPGAEHDRLLTWQAAASSALNTLLSNTQQMLLAQIWAYAVQLELLEPNKHNAEQEFDRVALALSCVDAGPHRITVLVKEARALMLAVIDANKRRGARTSWRERLRQSNAARKCISGARVGPGQGSR